MYPKTEEIVYRASWRDANLFRFRRTEFFNSLYGFLNRSRLIIT
jgi:hypothetical protein